MANLFVNDGGDARLEDENGNVVARFDESANEWEFNSTDVQGVGAFASQSISTGNESGVYKAHNYPGSTLAQQVDNAVSDAPIGAQIEVEPKPDGSAYAWDTELTYNPRQGFVGGITLDFGDALIDASVNTPITFDTAGELNTFGDADARAEIPTVEGGHWRLPSGGSYVVEFIDVFGPTARDIAAYDNGVAVVSIANRDIWTEYADVRRILADNGPGAVDFRPSIGSTTTESFIHPTVDRLWIQEPSDWGARFRGLLQWGDIGLIRGQLGVDNSSVVVADGNFQGSWLGPVRAEEAGSTIGTSVVALGSNYDTPPVYREVSGPVSNVSGSGSVPEISVDFRGFTMDDKNSDQVVIYNFNTRFVETRNMGVRVADGSNNRLVELDFDDPDIYFGENGAAVYLDSNGDLVAEDEAGNTTVLT